MLEKTLQITSGYVMKIAWTEVIQTVAGKHSMSNEGNKIGKNWQHLAIFIFFEILFSSLLIEDLRQELFPKQPQFLFVGFV